MTKEEAIKVIQHMAYLSAHVVENGVEAYEYIEQFLSKPSLPSNLDEAAEDSSLKYSIKLEECGITASDSVHYRTGFKAGAEWMVKQGVTLEGRVCKDEYAAEAPFYYVETENSDDLPIVGDKVVVQIREE